MKYAFYALLAVTWYGWLFNQELFVLGAIALILLAIGTLLND